MIYAKEKLTPFTVDAAEIDLPLFCRINITQRAEVETFLALEHKNKTPLLFLPSLGTHSTRMDALFIDEVTRVHQTSAEVLMSAGISRIAIAADNDGALHKLIAPRHRPKDVLIRAFPLLALYQTLSQKFPIVDVFLTVEDLSPGGLDATDGIAIARELGKQGLKEIVATSGTRAFPPLFDRRATQKKSAEHNEFASREPSLASALWLLNNTDLGVYCCAYIDDRDTAMGLAQDLGLQGIIEKAQITAI